VLETGTGGDTAVTRFGMRDFHFDTATKRAYLNGRVYFMRGSNITLHRFFEDP
jgi:beta-galactosidase